MADREPLGGSSRPTGEMPVTTRRPTTPHSTHDLVLLAAAADRNADPGLRAAAEAQLATCQDCATLAADLRALAAGLGDLPATRPAPRDMRLSVEQAARLRRGGLWRTLLRPFGAAGLPGLRPLAATLTTLGLAGLLITAIPLGIGGGSASQALLPGSRTVGTTAGEAGASSGGLTPLATASAANYGPDATPITPQAAESVDSAGPGASLGATTTDLAVKGATGSDAHGNFGYTAPSNGTRDTTGPLSGIPPLTVVSVALLAVGLALLSLRVVARRVD